MQKSKKKKQEKKFFYGTFSFAVFLFPEIKRAEKVSGFFFSVTGEGKCEIIYKKKKIYFCPLRSFFKPFLVVSLPEEMFKKCFGGKKKE